MIAVIDNRMPKSAKAGLSEICEAVELPPFSSLDARVASHPDMLMFKLGNKLFVCEEYYKEAKNVIDKIINNSNLELVLTNDKLGNQYPQDIKFNAFLINNTIIGNTKCISPCLKEYADSTGITLTSVNQGYAKCSTVVLDNAVITADKSIYKVAQELGADALHISPEGVELEGYDCGFLGGASGVWENKVFFCGNIGSHKNFDTIFSFCTAHGYEVISLSDEPLYDVGTIMFFE